MHASHSHMATCSSDSCCILVLTLRHTMFATLGASLRLLQHAAGASLS